MTKTGSDQNCQWPKLPMTWFPQILPVTWFASPKYCEWRGLHPKTIQVLRFESPKYCEWRGLVSQNTVGDVVCFHKAWWVMRFSETTSLPRPQVQPQVYLWQLPTTCFQCNFTWLILRPESDSESEFHITNPRFLNKSKLGSPNFKIPKISTFPIDASLWCGIQIPHHVHC